MRARNLYSGVLGWHFAYLKLSALQALTNVWWKNIENIIGCSETKFDQSFCTKHDKIIAHVFTMILHRTWKHHRPDVLWKRQAIYFAVWYKNSILVFAKNIRSVMVLGFVKGYIKYTCNYFIMFKEKSLVKLCLRALNDIFNVLPPNICQSLQC
jgi:hypothetical protein